MFQYKPLKTALHHHILKEMTLHLFCTSFLKGLMNFKPMLVRGLMLWNDTWTHDLMQWTQGSQRLKKILPSSETALIYLHHHHQFRYYYYYILFLKPCIWLYAYDILIMPKNQDLSKSQRIRSQKASRIKFQRIKIQE